MSSSGHSSILNSTNRSCPNLAIIGGSGVYNLPEMNVLDRQRPVTRYGMPSDEILIGELQGQIVAFLPRHGAHHTLPPHKIPYKANVAALKELGVGYIVATCVVGSLKRELAPGSFVIVDQFVNLTWGRDDSFTADGTFLHLPMAHPYCDHLRQLLRDATGKAGLPVVPRGTVAVIQGPRFSTIAESRWLTGNGWDIVNMTQYPECYFARELGLCYAAVAAVTDYDVGVDESLSIHPVNAEIVSNVFRDNIRKTKMLLRSFVREAAGKLSCTCAASVLKAYYADEHSEAPPDPLG